MENTPVLFDALLTSREAAKVWGINRTTVADWVKSGHAVPARQLAGTHGAYVFTGAEVERVAAAPRPKRGRPFAAANTDAAADDAATVAA